MIDKNQAVIDFLITCPSIYNSPLYFNFINAKNDNKQFVTVANDVYTQTPYIDGSVNKTYTFTIIDFKSISYNPVVKQEGYTDENVDDMAMVQALIDWVNEQDDNHNYPNFGESCIIESMVALTDNPNLDSIDTTLTPALAKYSISIRIDYLDISKKLWNKTGGN